MKKLIIVGDSSFAEIAYEYFTYDSDYEVSAFAVEKEFLTKDSLLGMPVISMDELSVRYPPEYYDVFVAVVYTQLNRLRHRLMDQVKSLGYKLASYISSSSFVWRNVVIGENCFIFEDNTVQPFVKIGNGTILWSGNHIGHHSIVGDYCFISSHVVISGHCEIGNYSFLGVNTTIANNVSIGRDNWLSPSVCVLKNTEDNTMYKSVVSEKARIPTRKFFKVGEV